MQITKTQFSVIPAFYGDSILIKTPGNDNNEFVILIDGGTASTFKYSLKRILEEVSRIDVLVLTHIDSDHIAGLIKLFQSSLIETIDIGEIWINHPDLIDIDSEDKISVKEGDDFKKLIQQKKPNSLIRQITIEDDEINIDGVNFKILSPTKKNVDELYEKWKEIREQIERRKAEKRKVGISKTDKDYSESLQALSQQPFKPQKKIEEDIFNASSISFLLTCTDVSILYLADSRPEIIINRLKELGYTDENPIKADYVKVSHHGSLNNTSQELLSLINSDKFIISTNGGNADHIHPSRETIARIVYKGNRSGDRITIYFNYDIQSIKDRIGQFIRDSDFEDGNWNVQHQNDFE